MRRRWAAVLAAMLGVLAFGSGLADSQPREVVIGAPNSLTGGFGEAGRRVVMGLELACEEINRRGGIEALGGAKLKVIAADTSSDNPSQAASVTGRLIRQDGAVVLVGSHTSTMTLSSQIEAERARVPIITTSYADAIVERGYKYTFKIPPGSSRFAEAGVDYLLEMYREYKGTGLKRVAVFHGTDASSQTAGKAYITLAKARGLQVVASGSFPSGLTDPTPVVAPVLQSKPEAVFLNSFTNDVILVTRALRNIGIRIPIVSSGGGISTRGIGEGLGASANGLMGTVAWNWDLPIDGVQTLLEILKRDRPGEPFPPAFEAVGEGYAIGWLIKAALEKAGSTDPRAIRDALAAIDVPAVLPGERIAFDERGLNKHLLPVMVGWVDGELRTLWPSRYQTRRPAF